MFSMNVSPRVSGPPMNQCTPNEAPAVGPQYFRIRPPKRTSSLKDIVRLYSQLKQCKLSPVSDASQTMRFNNELVL